MATPLEQLTTTRDNYLAALAADSVNPQKDYALDGESVQRDKWRAEMLARVKELGDLINLYDPFEIRTVAL